MVNESKQIKVGIHDGGSIDIYVLDKNYPYIRGNDGTYFTCSRSGNHAVGKEIHYQSECDRTVLHFKHLKDKNILKLLTYYLRNHYYNV